MPLCLKLPPNSRVIVNGCVLRNADRVQTIYVENHADIILEKNIVREQEVRDSLCGRAYLLMQTALVAPAAREALVPEIHGLLAKLIGVFGPEQEAALMTAATHVSVGDFYKAMRAIKPVWTHEDGVRAHIAARDAAGTGQTEMEDHAPC